MVPDIIPSSTQPILDMRDITKRFPGVVALDRVSLQCHPGEVHAIVGENGAGKSTLMKILVGVYQPDQGEIFFDGRQVRFHHPRQAQQHGISIIYQEFNLLPYRTVAQNIFLGREPTQHGMIDNRQMEADTIALLERLDAASYIAPDALVRDLSVAQQQIVEIAKALSFESRILVMDEPTAALATDEVNVLYQIVYGLRKAGIAIIYISHRFPEIFELSDRISVLKDGQLVGTVPTADVTSADLVFMMVGRELDSYYPPYAEPDAIGDVLLRIRDGANTHLSGINLELRAGEIVGLAGLQGSGRTELARAIFGVEPFTKGTVEIRGEPVRLRSPLDAIQHKIGFITEDRKQEGLALRQSVRDNVLLALRSLRRLFEPLIERSNGSQPSVQSLTERVDVRAAGMGQEVQYLSGGNQQKVVLAKWLAVDADILLADEPTRGIDINAKAGIHDLLRQLAKDGTAVLMISSELPEVIGMSDRILVMRDGAIAGELPASSEEADIMLLATGHAAAKESTQ